MRLSDYRFFFPPPCQSNEQCALQTASNPCWHFAAMESSLFYPFRIKRRELNLTGGITCRWEKLVCNFIM